MAEVILYIHDQGMTCSACGGDARRTTGAHGCGATFTHLLTLIGGEAAQKLVAAWPQLVYLGVGTLVLDGGPPYRPEVRLDPDQAVLPHYISYL